MSGRALCAYFFIPLAKRPATDDELFARLGKQPDGQFGPMTILDRKVTALSDHVCVQLYFLAAELEKLRYEVRDETLSLERDAGLPFAYAIRDGAAAAGAEVALLETHIPEVNHTVDLERVLERYWMILLGDATGLAIQWFGLLYLSDEVVAGWQPEPGVLDRDELAGGPGRTLFGGRGWTRWA
jgi:hypothetical protein